MTEIFRTLIASYLIATLGATALAKLKNRQVVSVGIQREGVIPARFARAVTFMLVIIEFSLATLLTFGASPAETDLATALLFVTFAAYRMLVAVKTKSLTCSCSGTIQADPASFPSVFGASLACLIMAALACLLVVLFGRPAGYPVNLLAIAAWITPLIVFSAGARRGSAGPKINNAIVPEFIPLWTAEMNAKRPTL